MRSHYKIDQRRLQIDVVEQDPITIQIYEGEESRLVSLPRGTNGHAGRLSLDNRHVPFFVSDSGHAIWVTLDGQTYVFEKQQSTHDAQEDDLFDFTAPMPGKIIQVAAKAGDQVQSGDLLIVLEAMKMEHRIEAPAAGTVAAVHVEAGQVVEQGFQLVDFEPVEEDA